MASLMTLPPSFTLPGLKSKARGGRLTGRGPSGRMMIGLVVGGLAAAFAAFTAFRFYITFYRNRTQSSPGAATRTRRNTADTPASASLRTASPVAAPALQQASMDWILAGRGMDTLIPAAYSIPLPETQGLGKTEADENRSLASDAAATQAGASTTPDRLSPLASGYGAKSGSEPWVDALRTAMEHKPLKYGYDKSVWTAPLLGHYLQETQGVSVTPQRLRSALKDLGYYWKHTHYAPLRPGNGRHH
jgi:winged helix-turn-helix protein